MNNLSNQTQVEIAIQMVIMDAIEKGHSNKESLIEYMNSKTFESAVSNYISIMNENK